MNTDPKGADDMSTESEISPFSRRAFGALEKRTADAERRAAASDLRAKEAEARARAAEARSPDAEVLLHITERLDIMADRLDAIEKAARKRLQPSQSKPPISQSQKVDCDLLYGVPAIANLLGLTDRQVRHLADTKAVPTFKLPGNKIICARRSTLVTWLAEQEAAARKTR